MQLTLATGAGTTVGSLSGTIAIPSGGTNYDAVNVTSSVTVDNTSGSGTNFKIVLGSGVTADAFWNTPFAQRMWSDIFTGTLSGGFDTANIQVTGPGAGNIAGMGSFSITGTSLTWAAIPEPSSAVLSGLLIMAGLLRRRHQG